MRTELAESGSPNASLQLQVIIPTGNSTILLVHANGAPWIAGNGGLNRYKTHYREWVDRSILAFSDENEQYFGTSRITQNFTAEYLAIRGDAGIQWRIPAILSRAADAIYSRTTYQCPEHNHGRLRKLQRSL